MQPYLPYLETINQKKENLISTLQFWANINSHSENIKGLNAMLTQLQKAFKPLGGEMQTLPLPDGMTWDMQGKSRKFPLGEALSIRKRPNAPLRILFSGHMDTVFPASCPFQKAELLNAQTMRGPGVSDMKGGLLIMLSALENLESSSSAKNIGWEVLITPDEEIGSLGSRFLLGEAAKRNHLGLVFEPAFPDGSLVSERKGSGVFIIVAHGTSAHVGRDFHEGRSALIPLARIILKMEDFMRDHPGVVVNVGQVEGGEASNIVPSSAVCKLNIRMNSLFQFEEFKQFLTRLLQQENKSKGINLTLHEQTHRPPKVFDEKTRSIFNALQSCAMLLDHPLTVRPTGGVSDGNFLAAAGLPTLDTLGAIGGNLHTYNEYILLESLVQRTHLLTLFLLKLAEGELHL